MKKLNIGRNDPCWCGSGLKFKRCHHGREEATALGMQDMLDASREAKSSKHCLHPDAASCSKQIIRAHTIQKNGSLSKIARDNKVLSFKDNNIADIHRDNGLATPKLVSTKSASTFTGFCGYHDDLVFAPIEKSPFQTSPEHAFLFGYRHFCLELYAKESTRAIIPKIRRADSGRGLNDQLAIQSMIASLNIGNTKGLEDVSRIKAEHDNVLMSGDYSTVRYYVIRFAETPDIMVSSGFFPEFDFDGNVLQDLSDMSSTPNYLAFSLVATHAGGAAIFTWLGVQPESEKLVRSLHMKADAELVQAIVRFVFEFFENAYFSPDWWNALPETTKISIRTRFSTAADPTQIRLANCLLNDGVSAVNWTIVSRETNLTF